MSPPPKLITVSLPTCVARASTSANVLTFEMREVDVVLAPRAGGEAENRVGAIARRVDEAVVAGAAIEEVRAGPAVEPVGARAAEQPVVAGAAASARRRGPTRRRLA